MSGATQGAASIMDRFLEDSRATGRQVSRSIRFEGLVIGTVATVLGLVGGYLLAMLLRFLLISTGFGELPGSIPIRTRTLVIAAVVGIGTTVASTIGPSRRVRSIPPVAALRDDVRLTPTGLRHRLQAGGLVALLGVALLAVGMTVDLGTRPLLFSLGLGALGTFLGVYLLSPVVARPVADLLGRQIQRIYGIPGRLARHWGLLDASRRLITLSCTAGSSVTKYHDFHSQAKNQSLYCGIVSFGK